jgi:prepilin-type N-terminal cleavage/methylation domain-containing protein
VRARGFTLVEIAIVLVIVGIMLSMALSVVRSLQAGRVTTVTTAALQRADDVLVAFVMVNKRLPCPANGTLAPGDPNFGVEQGDSIAGTCTGSEAGGVLPWTTLAVGVGDTTDGYGGVLTYRVDPNLTKNDAMNFTKCDPAGAQPAGGSASGCAPGCQNGSPTATPPADPASTCTSPSNALTARGLMVRATVGGAILLDPAVGAGAAYVLISHGPNHSGGYTPQGGAQGATGTVGTDEAVNVATAAVLLPPSYYVDKAYDGTDTATHFDDALSHPTVIQLATRANTAPRTHN